MERGSSLTTPLTIMTYTTTLYRKEVTPVGWGRAHCAPAEGVSARCPGGDYMRALPLVGLLEGTGKAARTGLPAKGAGRCPE